MMEEDRILFDAADVNKDGKLDAVEFLSFSHPEEDPKMVAPGNCEYSLMCNLCSTFATQRPFFVKLRLT